jgi:hypothetical protein
MMIKLPKLELPGRQRLNSLLGFSLDGGRLEGVLLRRTNGSFEVQAPLSVALSLDPLTNDPELVGREIQNHLDASGIRERHCVICLPLKWALSTHIEVPQLAEADIPGFLQIEAERGFPCDIETLHLVTSRCQLPSGKQQAMAVGVPKNHLALLDRALRAAKLKPLSFSFGITALQPAKARSSEGVLALAIGESHVAVQLTCGGGVAALRVLEGALETEGSRKRLQPDMIGRETRITLGQLPAEVREMVRKVRVFGPHDLGRQLADEIELRLEATGLSVEYVSEYAADELGLEAPKGASVSPALSLAAQRLAGQPTLFEFLPPRVTAWQQVSSRYAAGKLRSVIGVASSAAALVGALFFYQQCQLWGLRSQWQGMAAKVTELDQIQDNIKRYRPWFDESVRGLTILRALTSAFPEDGTVTAKTIEIRDLGTVTCTGTARNYQVLLRTVQKLRAIPQVKDVKQGPARGQPPALQFSLTFAWNEGGASAN